VQGAETDPLQAVGYPKSGHRIWDTLEQHALSTFCLHISDYSKLAHSVLRQQIFMAFSSLNGQRPVPKTYGRGQQSTLIDVKTNTLVTAAAPKSDRDE
jgi:hypothetical protein